MAATERKRADNPLEKDLVQTSWGWGRTRPEENEVLAFRSFPWSAVYAGSLGLPALLLFYALGLSFTLWTFVAYAALVVVTALPVLAGVLVAHSRWVAPPAKADTSRFLEFKDPALRERYAGRRVPVHELYEAYIAGQIDIKGDTLEALRSRYEFAHFVFTIGHVKFFLGKLIPELLSHTRAQDVEQVTDHYDRSNIMYSLFLQDPEARGDPRETQCYTSGIFNSGDDTLEQAQLNKLALVAAKTHMRPGMRHLDFGSGWGTLVAYAAKNHGTDSTGVTLAKEQVKQSAELIEELGLSDRARCLVMDYRDAPREHKYDVITNLEMSEHVGIKRYPAYCRQVYDMLDDDGTYFLQIAGLRRAWQYEDLMWGIFMGTHVFPGADASCPLGWTVNQLEAAGFEVRSVETVGIHYSATIQRWYNNWTKNKAKVVEELGEEWYRRWSWFLAWSVISPESGMASCYQIVAHKNTRNFNRKKYIAERAHWDV